MQGERQSRGDNAIGSSKSETLFTLHVAIWCILNMEDLFK